MTKRTDRRAGVRHRWSRASLLALCTVSWGCASRQVSSGVLARQADDRAILGLVQEALQADAAARPADGLYLATSTIIANGADRGAPPRFAGVGVGGRVRITAMSGRVAGDFAWAMASYQWISADGAASEAARASFVFEQVEGVWRIRHVHSSLVLPWQTG